MTERDDFKVCSCIATNHKHHVKGQCDEPPQYRGGICSTCRYYFSKPSEKESK